MRQPRRRVCLLTGASGTLGSSICERFHAQYDIAAVHFRRNIAICSQNQHSIDPLGPESPHPENTFPAFAIRSDLTHDSELQRVVELVLARFGHVDVLINAAGCCISRSIVSDSPLMESAELQYRLNVLVPLKLTKLLVDACWRSCLDDNIRDNRNIINISSIAGVEIFCDSGYVVYGSSKAALNFLTCAMAEELRSIGLRANAVAPNTFPSVVHVDDVVDAVQRIDSGPATGKIFVLDSGANSEQQYSHR